MKVTLLSNNVAVTAWDVDAPTDLVKLITNPESITHITFWSSVTKMYTSSPSYAHPTPINLPHSGFSVVLTISLSEGVPDFVSTVL